MFFFGLIALLPSTATASVEDIYVIPIEPGSILPSGWTDSKTLALVFLIRLRQHKCDSVSNITEWLPDRGFTVKCNRFSYSYEIYECGGQWVVTVMN